MTKGNEVALSIGVCDRKGSTVGDLREEERQDTALGADDVAETNCRHTGVGDAQREEDEFGDALRGTHDAEWIDGLVR